MTRTTDRSPPAAWDAAAAQALIEELWALRQSMFERQTQLGPWLRDIHPAHHASAGNLAHYLAMRRLDLRDLQRRLASTGVSSLGRSESHVLANVDKVLGILHRLLGKPWTPLRKDEPAGFHGGSALLSRHAEALFGPPPADRRVRIMVTLPSEAAAGDDLPERLVGAGMDIARINCAHDDAAAWEAMALGVRRAAAKAGRAVRVLMDLGGPKLRTGPVSGAGAVFKLKPRRDALGRVTAPARLGVHAAGTAVAVPGADLSVGVDPQWLAGLRTGERVDLRDARGAHRRLGVLERSGEHALLECRQSAYLTDQTRLQLHCRERRPQETALSGIPVLPGQLHLQRGQTLRLVAKGIGHDAQAASGRRRARPATIACTLPQALDRVRTGQHVWFDDGRIGGVVRRADASCAEIEITEAREGGESLAADKGINLPDTRLDLPAVTPKDFDDLAVAARCADIVGLSFAQSAQDVRTLRARLSDLGAGDLGLILKIETRRGFEHLPELLLAAMAGPAAGVMIARGDLAVECGYERMAEVQEEILWACEAAHMPVVWATQVLETLAKTGLPSRAEITDAAMGGRAECVMLNKGPHIVGAMRTLDNILRRMQSHQSKKSALLRALKAWNLPLRRPSAPTRT